MKKKLGTRKWVLLSVAALLLLSACSSDETVSKEVIEKSGTRITVMDNQAESVYTRLKLERIDKLEGVRGMDWASEDSIVVSQENKAIPAEIWDGQKHYPQNLYLYDLSSGQQTPLKEGKDNLGGALLSPDKTYVFYKAGYESSGIGYIMNLATGDTVKTGEGEIAMGEGTWSDNTHVLYSEFPPVAGKVVRVDAYGKSEPAMQTEAKYVANVIQSGTKIYFTAEEDSRLIAYDTQTKTSEVLGTGVMWVIPSPDGSRLAVQKRVAPGKVTLFVTDGAGNELSTVYSGFQIFGTNWSPDGSKLAYSTSSENGNENRLFITEVETNEQTPISDEMQASDQLRWSPSGKKLLGTTTVWKGEAYQFITYVITLS
ncbi:hypothetical protein GCM10010912_08830 [Paenibacillus albidus]|uniref:Uncharacterized protein n=1 Tax=Paenibacillus albidus TaxID=2041023 RepID=A0A917FCW5_9BACL|nr:PD40 domain-containing protein [Paenibacillus albidus]GGF66011.1 hypothetical protein GCM10010912_08830 [Paenibacillus albidus]